MVSKTALIGVLLAILGIAVAFVGFIAEDMMDKQRSQLTLDYVGFEPVCKYPSSPAIGLAIAAIATLVITRAIITSTTGDCCSCCETNTNEPKVLAEVCNVISWITSFIAVILFLAGAKLSSQKGVLTNTNDKYYCYTVKPGVFTGAGIMGLASVLMGLVYYLLYVSARIRAAEKSHVDLELEKPPIAEP